MTSTQGKLYPPMSFFLKQYEPFVHFCIFWFNFYIYFINSFIYIFFDHFLENLIARPLLQAVSRENEIPLTAEFTVHNHKFLHRRYLWRNFFSNSCTVSEYRRTCKGVQPSVNVRNVNCGNKSGFSNHEITLLFPCGWKIRIYCHWLVTDSEHLPMARHLWLL